MWSVTSMNNMWLPKPAVLYKYRRLCSDKNCQSTRCYRKRVYDKNCQSANIMQKSESEGTHENMCYVDSTRTGQYQK